MRGILRVSERLLTVPATLCFTEFVATHAVLSELTQINRRHSMGKRVISER